jgi:N-methylhydantoinase A
MAIRVGIDTGGTFTDLVAIDMASSKWYRSKVSSIPGDPLRAIVNALHSAGIDPAQIDRLILGTTVGTNALIQRKGANVAYVTTKGFEDIPFIQRGNRKFHYDLHWIKPKPFLDRRNCLGITERVDYRGAVVTPLETGELEALGEKLEKLCATGNLQAIAVNLLFSYLNPLHEIAVGKWLEQRFPRLSISLSHRVASVWREYERGITTIADAYLKPLLHKFISDIAQGLRCLGFRGGWSLMKSNGGTRLAKDAANEPIQLLLSGLAGGVMAGKYFGLEGGRDLITLDMGGTSCDLAVITGGHERYAAQFDVEFGLPLVFPTIELTTIGAGGGSIAWLDRGGFLRVGPQSAGANPGPACYGQGGVEPTVTDANLLLGRLDPDYFLGGNVRLDPAAAATAVSGLAGKMGISKEDAALAIIDMANENMVNAIRIRTVEVGIDPRSYCLVAFGGAGALHACAIARRLKIRYVLIPPHPGLCSAYGALIADLRSDQVATVSLRSTTVPVEELRAHIDRLAAMACKELTEEGVEGKPLCTARLAMRYAGQNYEHEVDLPTLAVTDSILRDAFGRFEALHQKFYGYRLAGEVIEVVNIGVRAVDSMQESLPSFKSWADSRTPGLRKLRLRPYGELTVPVHPRDALRPNWTGVGPMIIEDVDATILMEAEDRVKVLESGSLVVELVKEQA